MTGLILTWAVFGLCSACDEQPAASSLKPEMEEKRINLKDLPDIGREFKLAPYIRAAAALQEMGKEKACGKLVDLAKTDDENGQVAILCRLLFSKKGKKPFRSPLLGDPICIGGTSEGDWPLIPIGIIDDVPFLVVINYNVAGFPEPSLHYLNHCLKNCEWTKIRFDQINDKIIERALKKLLTSRKWKRPLSDYERQCLISQTKWEEKGKK